MALKKGGHEISFSGVIHSTIHEEALGDLPEVAFLKFILRDPVVEQRYYASELPYELLSGLYRVVGGTPGFLAQIREVLKTITADDLGRDLSVANLPTVLDSGALQKARDEYCERIFTARLYSRLPLDSQRAVSRAAVYWVAVNLEGLESVTGESVEKLRDLTQQWQRYALAYPQREQTAGDLWTVYGLLRGWLLAPERLSPDERRAAHRAAGNFLCKMVENDRTAELGVDPWQADLEARAQYLAADDHEQAREVTSRISRFLARRGLNRELAQLNFDLLAYGEHPTPMVWIGRAYLDRGDYPTANEWYHRSLAAAGNTMPSVTAVALDGLAHIDLDRANYGPAGEKFEKALKIFQQINEQDGEASCWNNLAAIDTNIGNYGPAREKFQKALEIHQRIGDRDGEAASWDCLAWVDLEQGDYPRAREKFQKAAAIAQQTGDRTREAATWHGLATADLRERYYGPAREKFQKALTIRQQIGDRTREAATWHGLATADLRERYYGPAREKFQKALAIRQQIGDRRGEAATFHQLATVDLNVGNDGPAREKFQKALEIRQQIGDRRGEAATFHQLGFLAATLGRLAEGVRLVALCFLIDQSIGHVDTESDSRALTEMASQLKYSSEQLNVLLLEVRDAYQTDRGRGLVKAAFGGS